MMPVDSDNRRETGRHAARQTAQDAGQEAGHATERARQRRLAQLVAGVTVFTLLAGVTTAFVGPSRWGGGPKADRAVTAVVAAPPTTAVPSTTTTAPPPPPEVPIWTLLASPRGSVPTFAAPNGPTNGTVSQWYGYPLSLPVVSYQSDWAQVRLPQRPNGLTAWVRFSDMSFSLTPYRIIVHLDSRSMTIYKFGHASHHFPVGIGVPATPTVTGNFFITVRALSPGPSFGPFELSTSAHSEAIASWEGSGDALVAIHGPVTSYADSLIGSNGERLSNGCLRLHNADLAQLDFITPGTPIDIEP